MLSRLNHALMLMAIVLSIASPALAHTPPSSFASELDLRNVDVVDENEIAEPLPIIPASTFEDVARLQLPHPSIVGTLEQRTDAMLEHAAARTHRLFASDSAELASWPLAFGDENNINGERKLSLELHRATEFQALPFSEPATGLVYARARWYDPSTGSFLTPDPMGYRDSSNLYAFGAGDPVNNSDPTGECIFGWGGTCAEWANAGKQKLDQVRQFVDQNTGYTIADTAMNAQVGFTLDVIDMFVLDPLRVGDATGSAIGSGASGGGLALAVVQDVGRAATVAAGAGTAIKVAGKAAKAAKPIVQRAAAAYRSSVFSSEVGAVGGGVRNVPKVTSSFAGTRFASADDFASEAFSRYQRYVDEAYEATLRAETRGRLHVPQNLSRETVIGQNVDRIARIRMKRWLHNEGISEGPGSLVQVNRYLRDPLPGSNIYRIPDLRLQQPGHIFDATIGHKSWSSLQVQQFHSFSFGNRITIVRPTQLGGSYSLLP